MIELAERAIAAHGGAQVWSRAREIRVRVSSGGLAFATKLQGSAVRGIDARISTSDQRVVLEPYPSPGQRGVLEPDGSVRIETDAGELIDARAAPRAAFSDARHRFWWDRLDILYFATYALWTYTATPFVFAREGYALSELDPWEEDGERWRRLAVAFPEHIHTHCREQVFYIDAQGLIRRHDYTAEPLGGFAKAAHYCFDHQTFDGLVVPTHRRVFPRKRTNRPRGRPLLVWIDVPNVTIER